MSKENIIFDSSCFYIFMILHIMAQDLVWTLVKIELNQLRFPEMCLESGMRVVSRLSISQFAIFWFQSSEGRRKQSFGKSTRLPVSDVNKQIAEATKSET